MAGDILKLEPDRPDSRASLMRFGKMVLISCEMNQAAVKLSSKPLWSIESDVSHGAGDRVL